MNKILIFAMIVGLFIFGCEAANVTYDPKANREEVAEESKQERTYPGYMETIDPPGNRIYVFSRCYSGVKYLILISGSKFNPEDRRHTVTMMYGADGKVLACNDN